MTRNLFPLLFISGVFLSVTGALFKIMHWTGAEALLIVVLVLWVATVLVGIREVSGAGTLNRSEKTMWIVGLIFLSHITSLVYLFNRQRILK